MLLQNHNIRINDKCVLAFRFNKFVNENLQEETKSPQFLLEYKHERSVSRLKQVKDFGIQFLLK